MIVRERGLVQGGVLSVELVRGCIREFVRDHLERLDRLKRYYEGQHDIMDRVRTRGLPNNRLVHGFPRYISTMAAGYMIGSPASYVAPGQEKALEAVLDCYKGADIESVDAELATGASIFGRSVEIVYMDEAARPCVATLDPRRAFVVYDDTVRHRPLFALHWREQARGPEAGGQMLCDVYTEESRLTMSGPSLERLSFTGQEETHYFGEVPVIEYWNNAEEMGDFEPALSLIDAYDLLQSDRANDKQQFADALLVLTGVMLDDEVSSQDARTPGERLREDKAICLPDREAKVEWLTKQLNEADTQVLADSIVAGIHKLCMIPDLTDENFAGNSSGVAMKYKLLGMEQLTRIKERWFLEGLRTRLRLVARVLAVQGLEGLDASGVQISFARALPANELEIAQTVQLLRDLVPEELLLAQLPFVKDPKAVLALGAGERA